jgi:hypothetical protein
MRLVLAFLAVLALLINPVTAAASEAACLHDGSMEMAGMTMTAPTAPEFQKSGADPCCGHSGQHGKTSDASCAQACAATCGVAVALAAPAFGVMFAPLRVEAPLARTVPQHPYEPPGLKRPPKSMAWHRWAPARGLFKRAP